MRQPGYPWGENLASIVWQPGYPHWDPWFCVPSFPSPPSLHRRVPGPTHWRGGLPFSWLTNYFSNI